MLGRYRILETNETGGFGSVHICWDARLQRRVAIKRMPLRIDDNSSARASTVDEALAEARTSSMLAHPNIVRMYDFESDSRYSYLVMEYVDGLSLADILSRVEGGVLTFDECAHLIDSVASALAYAHENGVLHLDIKPANILIDRSGTVKLGDFGMASLASAAGFGGARGGTVGYMPPEQIEGDFVDERTDVFALAVVVWEALTGMCPYAASTPEESLKLMQRGPSPTLSRIEPALAGIVEETLLHALDPVPATRMAAVDTFAHDMVRALGDTQDGRESLEDLLTQAEENEEPNPVDDWGRLQVPLQERFPWLGELVIRLLAAATAGWAAYVVLPLLFPGSFNALAFGVAGVAVASIAWPPLGGALGITALVAAICTQPSHVAIPLALLIAIEGIAWWALAGRRYKLGGVALLLPSCLGSPFAGVGLAGYSMGACAAFFTGAASWLVWMLFRIGFEQGFEAESLAARASGILFTPTSWIAMGACGIAAMLCALIGSHGGALRGALGQIIALAVLGGSFFVNAHMENASIASSFDGPALGVALSLGATLSIVIILTGGSAYYLEGDERI